MWWAGTRPRDLYLGTRAVHVCDGAGVRLSRAVDGWEAALAAGGDFLASDADKHGLRVWLSGGLCRPYLLPEAQSLRNRDEMRKVAAMLAAPRTGLAAPCEIRLDVGRPAGAPLAIAIEAQVLERITGVLEGQRLRSIGPWWAAVLNHALALPEAPGVLAVHDCDSLTVLMGRGGQFDRASTSFPMPDRITADATVARAMLSAQPPVGPRQQWRLAGDAGGVGAALPLGALAEQRT